MPFHSSRSNNMWTLQGSLVVLVFQSDSGTTGQGFTLQFHSNGSISNPKYSYLLRHVSTNSQFGFQYPFPIWADEDAERPNANTDILVVAHNFNSYWPPEEGLSSLPTKLSWTCGRFRKARDNESCEYGSVKFFTTPQSTGWTQAGQFPNVNDTQPCNELLYVPQKSNFATALYSSFMVIYKPAAPENQDEDTLFNNNNTLFEYSYYRGT